MTGSIQSRCDMRTIAERDHADRMHLNLQTVLRRQNGTLLNPDERMRAQGMRDRIDAMIDSRSERQRERAYRTMDRLDRLISVAWHRAALQG